MLHGRGTGRFAYGLRERRRVARPGRALGDVGIAPDRVQRPAGVQAAVFVQVLGQVAGQQKAVVDRQAGHDGAHHLVDDGGAVGGDRVIEARLGAQRVGRVHIGQEQRAHRLGRHADGVDRYRFAAHGGAHPHDVALVGGDHAQLELLEEAAQFRELLAAFLADLDREHHALAIVEAKGHQGVGDGRHAPGGQDHVHAAQPAQVVVAGVPAGVVVGVAAPVEVAHVPQAHVVALHRALRHAAHLVGPVAVVGRPQRVPPDQQRDEGQRPPRPPAAAGAQGTTDDQQAQQPEMQRGPGRHGHAARRRAAGKLEPQRAGAPGGQRQQADAGQQAQPGEGRR